MGKLVLVTGGARSGKSSYAESIIKKLEGEILYIATSIPFDDEMRERVKKHRERRPIEWHTYEGYKNLKTVFKQGEADYKGILLDCVTIMLTNLMFDKAADDIDRLSQEAIDAIEEKIIAEVKGFIDAAEKSDSTIVMVTNEVGDGIVPENKLARIFRDIAGRVNQYIASRSDEVYLVVCGMPVKIK